MFVVGTEPLSPGTGVLILGSFTISGLAFVVATVGIDAQGSSRICDGTEVVGSSELASLILTRGYIVVQAMVWLFVLVSICCSSRPRDIRASRSILLTASLLVVLFTGAWLTESLRNEFVCDNPYSRVLFWGSVVELMLYAWIGVLGLNTPD